MRLFAVSDLHVDYQPNVEWINALSRADFTDDALIVAGDLSHRQELVLDNLAELAQRFAYVLFVPGNHDIWVSRQSPEDSLTRHDQLLQAVETAGVRTQPLILPELRIVPLLSWYDFSFGEPIRKLRLAWMDFHRCRWPQGWGEVEINANFLARNPNPASIGSSDDSRPLVTFSHFMPRADLLPELAVKHFGWLLPVLGGWSIDTALRRYQSTARSSPHHHVYGHSHVNVDRAIDGVRYLNNARGYPNEPRYAQRRLREIDFGAPRSVDSGL
ncbi:MAG: metallophosphoesterase [Pseudomonadales bacterium]